MSYRKDRALRELFADGFLDTVVRLLVHGCGSLIKDQNFGPLKQCPSKTDELALTNTGNESRGGLF